MIRAARADGAMLKMPVARYFFFVGAALLALLFVADAWLPKLPATAVADAGAETPVIRIQSDRKWPERIVFDTSIPVVSPVQTAAAAVPVPTSARVADVSVKVREAFAQLQPADAKPAQQVQPAGPKAPVAAAPVPPKRKVAKKRTAPPMVLVAQQQQPRPFGFFGNNTW
jgi:hypothetical protein